MLADDPVSFATACRRVLSEVSLRDQLVRGGHELLIGRFQGNAGADQVRLAVETARRGGVVLS